MRKRWKRAISFLVSASMVVCMMPTAAFAKTTEGSAGEDTSVTRMVPEEASTAEADAGGQGESANVASTEVAVEPASTAATEELAEPVSTADTEEPTEAVIEPVSTADTEEPTEAATEAKAAEGVTEETATEATPDTGKVTEPASEEPEGTTEGDDKEKPNPSKQGLLGNPNDSQSDVEAMTYGESYYFELAEDQTWLGSFTAQKKGSYLFHLSYSENALAYLYSDAEMTDLIAYDKEVIPFVLDKGETVYCKIQSSTPEDYLFAYVGGRGGRSGITKLTYYYGYTGEPVKIEATVEDQYGVLTEGLDYKLVFVDDADMETVIETPVGYGYYGVYAQVNDIDGFVETTSPRSFQIIDRYNLSAASFKLNKNGYEETGEPVEVDAVVRDATGYQLKQGVDYIYIFNENVAAPSKQGEYRVEVRGIGKYYGESLSEERIYIYDPKDIGDKYWFGYSYDGASEFQYQETEVTLPNLYLSHRNENGQDYVLLKEGQDYQFAYYEKKDGTRLAGTPTEVGYYNAVYQGCGSYTGEFRWEFKILGDLDDFSYATFYLEETIYDYTGDPITPTIWMLDRMKDYSIEIFDGVYESVYYDEYGDPLDSAPTEPGTYQLAARAVEGSGYTGETPKVTFYIRGENDLAHQGFTYYYDSDYTYTGNARDSIDIYTVYSPSGNVMVEGIDYEFDHFEDSNGTDLGMSVTDPGNYYAVLKGKGDCIGEEKLHFTIIDPYQLSNASIYVNDIGLSGGSVTPVSRVSDWNNTDLENGTDYELIILDPRGMEVSSITETGKYKAYARAGSNGKYKGITATTTFTVFEPNDISESASGWQGFFALSRVELSAGKLPVPTICRITYDDYGDIVERIVLVEDRDYTLDHIEDVNDDSADYGKSFPDKPGYYRAYYKAQGDYTGTRSINFTIIDSYDLAAQEDYSNYWQSRLEQSAFPVGTTELPVSTIYHYTDDENKIVLQEGRDYELYEIVEADAYSAQSYGKTMPQTEGRYLAVYKGIEPYYGEIAIDFSIYTMNDLSASGAGWQGRFSSYSVDFNGGTLPATEVYREDENGQKITLKEGKDYELDHFTSNDGEEMYGFPSNEGRYKAVYKGIGDYTGSIGIECYMFDAHNLNGYSCPDEDSPLERHWLSYYEPDRNVIKGDKKLPNLVVYHVDENGVRTTLTENVDFKLDYMVEEEAYNDEDDPKRLYDVPKESGHYFAFYSGYGEYSGTIMKLFCVYDPYDLGDETNQERKWQGVFAPSDRIASGTETLPSPRIYCYEEEYSAATEYLTEGADYQLERIVSESGQTVAGGVPTEPGRYYAVYSGQGSYHGELEIPFVVYEENDIGNGNWNAYYKTGLNLISDSKDIERPELIVKSRDGQRFLTEGTDFKFKGYAIEDDNEVSGYRMVDDAAKGGSYLVVYSGCGDYSGELYLNVYVSNTKNLKYAYLELEEDTFEPTGKPVVLTAKVETYDGKNLEPSMDFDWVYRDEEGWKLSGAPTEPGIYYVRAEAKAGGQYTGVTAWAQFTINYTAPAVAAPVTMEPGADYDVTLKKNEYWLGKFTAPEDGLYFFESTGNEDASGKLYADAEMTTLIDENDDGGKGVNFRIKTELKANQTVYLYANISRYGAGNFTVKGGTPDGKDLSLATLSINNDKKTLVGNLLFPEITVTDVYGTVLTEGEAYDLLYYHEYSEDYGWDSRVETITKPGDYDVVAVGKTENGYQNQTRRLTFSVPSANSLYAGNVVMREDTTFTLGENVEDFISVVDGTGKELRKNVDYVLEYYGNDPDTGKFRKFSSVPTEEGSYWVLARAIGETYTERTYAQEFFIRNPGNLGHYYLNLEGFSYNEEYSSEAGMDSVPVYLYQGNAVEPKVVLNALTEEHEELDPKYYTVTYSNNEGPTTGGKYASVTVTGKAPYSGSLTRYFKIAEKIDLSTLYGYGEIFFVGKKTKLFINTAEPLTKFGLSDWEVGLSVDFLYGRDGQYLNLKNGVDYNATFIDEAGNVSSKVPTTAGLYRVVLTAVAGGKYTGSLEARFALVDDGGKPYEPIEIIDLSKAKVTLNGASYTYDGKAKNPGVKSVVVNGKTLVAGTDYTVTTPAGRKDVGTYTYTITGKGNYTGKATASFKINQATSKIVLQAQTKTYSGQAQKYSSTVTKSGSTGKVTYTYYSDAKGTKEVKPANVKNAKTYYVRATVKADKNHKAATSQLVKFTIKKAANTMSVKAAKKAVKAADLKKKNASVKPIAVSMNNGKLTYKLKSVKKNSFKKYFAVNAKTGKVTVKKGLKAGTYTLTVSVTAKGDANHTSKTKKVSFKIVVK